MRKINRNDTADHGAESVRLGAETARTGNRAVRTAASVLRGVFVHTAAVLISPVTWVIAGIGIVLYLLMTLLILLTGAAAQDNTAKQQAYAEPVALGAEIPKEIAAAKGFFEIAVNTKKQAFFAQIDALRYDKTDLPRSDTVYLVRNEPPATFQTSLATDRQKTKLKNAWQFGISEAEGIAIAYVLLEKRENEAQETTGNLYPVTFSQAVFDEIIAQAVAVTETQYRKQSCPEENCALHRQEAANPAYAEAQAAYNLTASRLRNWRDDVMPEGDEYAEALRSYRATPGAGQSYAWQRVEKAYLALTQAVSRWSSDYGVRNLTVDEQLCASMAASLESEYSAADKALKSTPKTTNTPYYTCDHLHTLHSFGLNFYTAEQVMQMLQFSEEEQQWAMMTAIRMKQYPEEGFS